MFAPIVPVGGYTGWKIFERTSDRQFTVFSRSPTLQRELAHFRENIGRVASAEALAADRRLLTVALGAFGLESEVSKRAIIRRVLEEPVSEPTSFANRLNDPRWRAFARAFGFADGAPRLSSATFQNDIAARFAERSFEREAGNADPNIRLALNFRREIRAIAGGSGVDRAGWFQILGQQPLRRVVEAAFGLPASFANLDIDRQRSILEGKAEAAFGSRSASAFVDPANVELTLRRFFLSQSLSLTSVTGSGAAALALLTGAGGGLPNGPLNVRAGG